MSQGGFSGKLTLRIFAVRLLDLLQEGANMLGREAQDKHSKGLSTSLGEFSSLNGLTESSCLKKTELSSMNSYKPTQNLAALKRQCGFRQSRSFELRPIPGKG